MLRLERGALLFRVTGWLAFVATAARVRLRLFCNLLDGMVALAEAVDRNGIEALNGDKAPQA